MKNLHVRNSMSVCLLAALVVCSACNNGAREGRSFQASGLAGLSPSLVLFNQKGQKVTLASLRGRPTLIAFIDTSCTVICRGTTNRLHEVARKLAFEQGRDVQFVLVTYNPLYDGTKRLAKYADNMGLDNARWMLLTGTPENVDWALRRFGLPSTSKVDNPMLLMNQLDYVFLVAPDGHIVNKYLGPDMVIGKVAQDTRAVLGPGTS